MPFTARQALIRMKTTGWPASTFRLLYNATDPRNLTHCLGVIFCRLDQPGEVLPDRPLQQVAAA